MVGIVPDVIEKGDAVEIVSFIFGSIGCFLMLGTYTLNILHKIETCDPRYCLANGLGGIFAMVAALLEALQGSFGSYPLVVLEGAWGIIGLIEYIRIVMKQKKASDNTASTSDLPSLPRPLIGENDDEKIGMVHPIQIPTKLNSSRSLPVVRGSCTANSEPNVSGSDHDSEGSMSADRGDASA
eukprot:CFRG3415T1